MELCHAPNSPRSRSSPVPILPRAADSLCAGPDAAGPRGVPTTVCPLQHTDVTAESSGFAARLIAERTFHPGRNQHLHLRRKAVPAAPRPSLIATNLSLSLWHFMNLAGAQAAAPEGTTLPGGL